MDDILKDLGPITLDITEPEQHLAVHHEHQENLRALNEIVLDHAEGLDRQRKLLIFVTTVTVTQVILAIVFLVSLLLK